MGPRAQLATGRVRVAALLLIAGLVAGPVSTHVYWLLGGTWGLYTDGMRDDVSTTGVRVVAALVIAPLSIIPTRRAGLVLIVLEGVAIVAMLILACAVLLLVFRGHGPQGDPPLRDAA